MQKKEIEKRKLKIMKENKSGYLPLDNTTESKETLVTSVSISEQETSILYMRDENFAKIYTSDSTQITRLDKLCETSPKYYSLIADTGRGRTYRLSDKSLISFRAKKKEMTDEQRKAAGERMKKYQANKNG